MVLERLPVRPMLKVLCAAVSLAALACDEDATNEKGGTSSDNSSTASGGSAGGEASGGSTGGEAGVPSGDADGGSGSGKSVSSSGGTNGVAPSWPMECEQALSNLVPEFEETGRLEMVQEIVAGTDFTMTTMGQVHAALSPDGGHLYLSSHFPDELLVFSRDPRTGALNHEDTMSAAEGMEEVLTAPTRGAFLSDSAFVLPSMTQENLVLWERDSADGSLTESDRAGFGTNNWPMHVVGASETNYHFVTIAAEMNGLAAIEHNPVEGTLGTPIVFDAAVEALPDFEHPEYLVATRDGKDIYALAFNSDTMHHFRFDEGARTITHLRAHKDGEQGNVLAAPSGIALSPDQRHVYVTAFNSHQFSVYERDCDTGDLTLVETYGNVDGECWSNSRPVVSPDGKNVYVDNAGGMSEQGVAIYSRDAATGRLEHLDEALFSFDYGGSVSHEELLVSDDGRFVYAVTFNPTALVTFKRLTTD